MINKQNIRNIQIIHVAWMEALMPPVSTAEFIRNLGTFQRMVAREPIEVTSHGKIAGVYVSAEDAALLKRIRASRPAYHP